MGSLGGSRFGKGRRCPSSQILLSCYRSSLSAKQASRIAFHLASCDFCAAELQLLSRYPLAEGPCEPATMPLHLAGLAKALMTKDRHSTDALLFRIYGTEPLAFNNREQNTGDLLTQ